ncbi:MAG: acetyl-CoA C-acyltransferase [Rhodospirillaceae bacterium]|nr:acetyl-CoA C-acyltransferase [Rhodospirillaceae bacterium]OUT80330.1 MAG: acetyl-CoA acetyltransferase [Rhodospirillaceae bacterium TMED23]|tara:strand:+ start:17676 stop:18863 length:1188 start_codon:yes stop_codon:yes gene_type:complete
MNKDPIVIVGSARTPMGGMNGALSGMSAPELGSTAIKGAIQQSGVNMHEVEDVVMGAVLAAGLGQAPARQAAIFSGLYDRTGATTINKMCGSGMKALMLAHDSIMAGSNSVMIAGGMESMTNAPYLLPKVRQGMRMGHGEIKDHMFLDGLEDAFERGTLMGAYAEATAERYQFTREAQDEFAIRSLKRANKAISDGTFSREIVPVNVKNRKNIAQVVVDEQPGAASPDKIPTLRPAFAKDGTVTAANSSSISDGAAALVLMKMSSAENKGLTPLAIVHAHASHSQEPQWFTTAPIGAIKSVLNKAGWVKNEVDLFEINEAFAVVTMAAIHDLDISADIVNIYGGACALGHPIGASGARIIVTLLNALAKNNLTKGVASLCIGGGEGVAVAIERLK